MPFPKNIIVCGGAGFIGSHLTDDFLARSAHVTVIDPCLPGTSGSPKHLPEDARGLTWIDKPVEELDVTQWDELMQESTLLVDAMGFTRHHEGLENPLLDLRLNYLNHLTLIAPLRRRPTPVIYLGSRGQYGVLNGQVSEDHPLLPRDPQGVHKVAAESMLRIYSSRFGFPCVSLRLGNCYGPRQPTDGRDIGLVGGFIRQLIEGESVELYGDRAQRARQIVAVEDVVKCVSHLACSLPSGFTAINLAGPRILLGDMLDILTDSVGGNYSFKPFPEQIKALDCGDGEIDQERLRRYWPSVAFAETRSSLENTCAYFKKELL